MAQDLLDDILYLIFLRALPFRVVSSGDPIDHRIIPPLNFSAVCRSWRSVVHLQPSLWSSIHIDHSPSEPNIAPHPSVLRFVETWLKKSNPAPLDLSLIDIPAAEDAACGKLFSLILREGHRWRAIDFNITGMTTQPPLTFKFSPSIISFNLRLRSPSARIPTAIVDLSAFSTSVACQLRELDLFFFTKWVFSRLDTLRLPNLRSLAVVVANGELDNMFRVLSSCPNISRLFIGFPETSQFNSTSRQSETIALPHLTNFNLNSSDPDSSYSLLAHLSCPLLQCFCHEMDISRTEATPGYYLQCVAAFLARGTTASQSQLLILGLNFTISDPTSYNESVAELRALLSPLESLRLLRLYGMLFNAYLIEELTVRPGNENAVLCPSLLKISLSCKENLGLRVETVDEMIVSRWMANKRSLREVQLGIPGFENFVVESERTRACVEEGLVVRLHSVV